MAACDAGKISLYIRSILFDLDVPQEAATILYEDNDGAIGMANAQKPTSRTRHMEVRYFALSEWVERDLLRLSRIHTGSNVADNFTKPLTRILFHRHADVSLGHIPPSYAPISKQRLGLPRHPIRNSKTPTIQTTPRPITAAAAMVYIASRWSQVLDQPFF